MKTNLFRWIKPVLDHLIHFGSVWQMFAYNWEDEVYIKLTLWGYSLVPFLQTFHLIWFISLVRWFGGGSEETLLCLPTPLET